MDLTIVIPSFNTKALLARCLSSVYKSFEGKSNKIEVIVVDNGSTDGSVEMILKKFPAVVLMPNRQNVGFGRANNMAIGKAKGEFVLLLNSDTEVKDDAISKLLSFGKTKPQAFIGGKLFNEDGSVQTSCGPFFTLPVVVGMLLLGGDRLGFTRFSPVTVTVVDWVSGACLLGKKANFERVGLFDEGIFMYMEEIDFLYRAQKLGLATIFYPDAKFTHTGAASSGTRREPVINIYRGLLYFYKKHYTGWQAMSVRALLRLKAYIAIGIGRITGNNELQSTYGQALAMV